MPTARASSARFSPNNRAWFAWQRVGSARPAAAAVAATATSGHDGVSATAQNAAAAEVEGSETDKTGIYALLKADIFNLLCIPPLTIVTAPSTVPNTVVDVPIASTWEKAAKLCEDRRALLIVDAPRSWTLNSGSADYPAKKVGDFSAIVRKNAALYFPTVRIPDPLQEGSLDDFAPCGIVAGVMSRTDAERGDVEGARRYRRSHARRGRHFRASVCRWR